MIWVFVGAGNMASSLVGGLVNSEVTAQHIVVVDPDEQACSRAVSTFGVRAGNTLSDALDALPDSMANQPLGFVIAVKPHIVENACRSIAEFLQAKKNADAAIKHSLVVSVAAGVRASSMQFWLPDGIALVRCMPNTPSLLGLGATALFANDQCSDEQKLQASELLEAAGMSIWVKEEPALDAVTALSGSGPAYFFYLIEHMAAAAVELGLDQQDAQNLAIETAFGAASMARAREHTPAVLRENVTSKGGTTAAALAVFDELNTPEIVKHAMQAAHARAVEFGDDLAPDPQPSSNSRGE